MSHSVQFVRVATMATGFEADRARDLLEREGIPVLTKGPQVGIFGAGFQGTVLGGVEIHVPSPELDRAKALLDG